MERYNPWTLKLLKIKKMLIQIYYSYKGDNIYELWILYNVVMILSIITIKMYAAQKQFSKII